MTRKRKPVGDILNSYKAGFASGSDVDSGVLQLRMHNVTKEGELDWSKKRRIHATARQAADHALQIDDVLVNVTNSPEMVGKTSLVRDLAEPTLFSNHFARLRPNDEVDAAYLARALGFEFRRGTFARLAKRWVNQATVSRQSLEALSLHLPPLPEQRRIAAVLDQVDELRALRTSSAVVADSALAASFSASNSGTWDDDLAELGELVDISGGKRLPRGTPYAEHETPFPYLRVSDMVSRTFKTEGLMYLTPQTQKQIERYTVRAGDLVMSIAGTIGQVASVPLVLSGSNLTENAARLRPRESAQVEPSFLAYQLTTAALQSQIRAATGQVTIGKLALFRIEKLRVSNPPRAIQLEFAKQVEQAESLRLLHAMHLAKLDELFASLERRAFTEDF